MQASRIFLGRASVLGVLAAMGMLIMPSTAHAAESTTGVALPVIELKAKSRNTTSTTIAPMSATVVTIPIADVTGDVGDVGDNSADDASTNTSEPETISAHVVNDNTSADVSDTNLASTGANTSRIVGLGMVLTAIGMALLAFTDAFARTERFVRSLLPNRLSGK